MATINDYRKAEGLTLEAFAELVGRWHEPLWKYARRLTGDVGHGSPQDPDAPRWSGLDVGSFATPVFYGWMLDHGMPQAVFYVVFAFTAAAIATVLQLPGQAKRVAA